MKTCLLCFVSCTGEPGEIEQYANNVARGARPAVPEDWPEDIKGLVQKCWSQEPAERPAMTEIIDSLKKFVLTISLEHSFSQNERARLDFRGSKANGMYSLSYTIK